MRRAPGARPGKGTLLFVDEVHRFNRAQQDSFLPVMEDGTVVLVGATTENPSFELNAALLSRARVLVFKSLDAEAIEKLLARAEQIEGRSAAARCGGARLADAHGRRRRPRRADARRRGLARRAQGRGVRRRRSCRTWCSGARRSTTSPQDGHYNLISALHKSVRGSDPDAALYYLCRMLDAGEDPLYLARRVVRMAIEDIGLADPQALVIANAAKDAYDFLGSPEGELAIAQAVIYVATAPKSNAAYIALARPCRPPRKRGSLLPPKHILNAPTKLMKAEGYGRGYAYDHDAPEAFLRPGLFPRGARPADVLRSAGARLRARDQEAARLLGEAAAVSRSGGMSRGPGSRGAKNRSDRRRSQRKAMAARAAVASDDGDQRSDPRHDARRRAGIGRASRSRSAPARPGCAPAVTRMTGAKQAKERAAAPAAVHQRADRDGHRRRSRHARRPLPGGAVSRACRSPTSSASSAKASCA